MSVEIGTNNHDFETGQICRGAKMMATNKPTSNHIKTIRKVISRGLIRDHLHLFPYCISDHIFMGFAPLL